MDRYRFLLILTIAIVLCSSTKYSEDWGFYSHRLINRTAIFTLPVELIPLYKSNIEFITEHSIDPDKRRYASPLEAVRHYIDLDHWGEYPFDEVPRDLTGAMIKYCSVHLVDETTRDTVVTWTDEEAWKHVLNGEKGNQLKHEVELKLFQVLDEGFLMLPSSWIPDAYADQGYQMVFTQRFTSYGILPYHLSLYQGRLTRAFKDRDWPLVIRLSTEMGHYLGDAHVPLHTTENYNGQLTGQDGIHAFWESRIPELFAEEGYDFFVGRAKYIEDTDQFFWDVVLESHTYVDQVLSEEMKLRNSFDRDKQYCFEERGAITTRIECRAYAAAYERALDGMVEDQMRKSIAAIGSAWYTAWVDAGRPALDAKVSPSPIDTIALLQSDSLAIVPAVQNSNNGSGSSIQNN